MIPEASQALRPYVWIDGQRLETRSPASLVAIADIRIQWGAEDWYSDVEPAKITVTLLDPMGDFLNHQQTATKTIKITRDSPTGEVNVFEGTISSVTSRLGKVGDPVNGEGRDVWFITITGTDPLGALASDRRHGPKYIAREPAGRRLHWGPQTMLERKQSLDARSHFPIIWQPARLDEYDNVPSTVFFYPVAPYETQSIVSVLTVLRQTARISELTNRPYFYPTTRTIRFVSPMTDAAIRISPQGPIGIEMYDGEILDGSHFRPDGEVSASSSALDQITRIERTLRYEKFNESPAPSHYTIVEQTEERNIIPGAPAQSTVAYTSDQSSAYDYFPAWDLGAFSIIYSTYGRAKLPPFIWKPELDSPTDHAHWFLTPEPPINELGGPLIFQLVNSLTNWIPGTGPFCITGGEIRFDQRGWRSTLHTPAAGGLALAPTLEEVTDIREIANTDPALIVADFHKVNYL